MSKNGEAYDIFLKDNEKFVERYGKEVKIGVY